MKKNILLFIKTPPPFHGASLINQYVSESELIKSKFSVKIIDIHYVNGVGELGRIKLKKIFIFCSVCFNLLNALVFFKPNFIYFQISPLSIAFYRDVLFILMIKIFNIPILFHLHGLGIRKAADKNIINGFIYKFVFKSNYLICLSEINSHDIETVYKGKPFIVNNGLKQNIWNIKIDLKRKDKNTCFLFLSNLFIEKGIQEFLTALAELKKRTINFSARIIGKEGNFTIKQLMASIENLGIKENVLYLGAIYGKEKISSLLNSDVFVLPTYNESWGMAILEAMEAALPVISTRVGSVPIMIKDGENGYLIEKGDISSLVNFMELLAKNPALCRKMGINGREKFLEKFTYDVFEKNMFKVFSEIL